MTERLLADDRAARRLAQVELFRPVALEAGAGTGKTTALVARLLAWTMGRGWDEQAATREGATGEAIAGGVLERVVAITFTEAAAAEMADRYQRELARFAGGEPLASWLEPGAFPVAPEERTRRSRALLAAVDRLRVQTIHSFAFALIRAHALEGGLHPALAVDPDESGLDEAIFETLAQGLPERYRAADPGLEALARAGFGPAELAEALTEISRKGLGAAALATDPWTREGVDAALRPASAAAGALAAQLEGVALSKRASASLALQSELPDLSERLAATPRTRAGLVALVSELGALLCESARRKLESWGKGKLADSDRSAVADAEGLSRSARALDRALAHLRAIDADFLDAARRTLAPLAEEVERRMRVRGLATYSDLLRLAVDLLARPGVASEARRGIRQLLVDEFQDTDELQCELVARLALEGPQDERPGLFLVGDPKQSIYGWRRARLGTYRAFVERALAGERAAPLVANFRSAAGVLAEVERVLAPLMERDDEVAARFAPLLAAGAEAGQPASIEYWTAWGEGEGRERKLAVAAATAREASAIAEDLRTRIDAGQLAPRDAAILLRSGTHLERYLEALRQRDVPFAVEKDRSYFRRRETIDAAALVRAALDPADLLALATLLRSPCVGVPDAALLPIWKAGVPELMATATGPSPELAGRLAGALERAAAAQPGDAPGLEPFAAWPLSVRRALEALLDRRAAFHVESADLWSDGLRRAFLPEAIAAARYQARYRLANLDRFFRELVQRLEEGVPIHRLLADLRSSVQERPDMPESRPLEGADNAVRVMTLHSAKGLEFREVYLAGLHHEVGGRQGAPSFAAERVGDSWEYRLFGVPTPGLAPAADLENRIRAAEQVRLLYVGMTRAVRRLVLSGALPFAPDTPDPERARALAQLLAARLPDADLATRLAASTEGWRDEAGALWRRLPTPGEVEPRESQAMESRPAAPSLLLADCAARRQEALARSDRPRAARVTEVALWAAEPMELEDEPPAPLSADAAAARDWALARGAALHRALELAPLAAAAPDRWRSAALATLERELDGADAAQRERFAADLDRLAASRLFARLAELDSRVIARETPVLLAAGSASLALDAVTGAIDLVYLDPETGEPVVADFKSDAVDEAGVGALSARYAPQLALYARAVADALGLPGPPRCELWLLALDQVVAVDDGRARAHGAPPS